MPPTTNILSNLSARTPVVCVQTTWIDLLIFYGANYVAHAGSVPAFPGAQWRLSLALTLLALFLPFAGLYRSLLLIWRHVVWGKDDFNRAILCGAALIVVRSQGWEPTEQKMRYYVRLPKDFDDIDEETAEQTVATIVIDKHPDKFSGFTDINLRDVHGFMSLPASGYTCSNPTPDYGQIIARNLKHFSEIRLSRSQSWIKMGIAVAQLIYSSITIYRTRGNQIDRYGYTAFGLSVFPYTVMSLVNLVCVATLGEYSRVYIIRTKIMEEAKDRGGIFHEAIGDLLEEPLDSRASRGGPLDSQEIGFVDNDQRYTPAFLWTEGQGVDRKLVVNVEPGTRTKRFRFSSSKDEPSLRYDLCEFGVPPVDNNHAKKITRMFGIPVRQLRTRPKAAIMGSLLIAMRGLVILQPLFIVIVTGFKRGQSTFSQRVWTITWVVAGQIAFIVIPALYGSRNWAGNNRLRKISWKVMVVLVLILFAIPSIGGWVVVGLMFKAFGSCSLYPS